MRRDGRDPRIPEALITRPEFIAACTAHDIGAVFALAERYGLSRSAISRMTEIKTDHVREIINGRRLIESFAVYERIADGLGIPGAMLGLAPRPWEAETGPAATHTPTFDTQPWELADAITDRPSAPRSSR
ncbi:hypothetical protein GCM10009839_60400 [Catenulispora yoronensis]|uniref:XRE family transcriptional regulator n=1 Tax=Catenulispora yoronensis TaxID=450799 RepID=A0ABN2V076_9ACTN